MAFTPWSALAGGVLIGAGASALLWMNGRIAGVTGIYSGIFPWRSDESLWRLLFVLGLIGGASLYGIGHELAFVRRPEFPSYLLALAGLLVGYGTSLGSGCTSGHGVCGLARLSLRSLVATLLFLFVAILTTGIVRHALGIY